jgi:enoyl-CoA hydratase/carnithine racemase
MSDVIRLSHKDAVATITLHRAADGNQLTIAMVRDLAAAFHEAGRTEAKVIALRSTGADFCRGRDTRGGAAAGGPPNALQMRSKLIEPLLSVYDAIANAAQPVVCAVQGAALGFGCALATACDITIASDAARFSLPEMEKNLPPTLAISAMMARVPQKALTWLVYTMREIDADTAWRLGIISDVVPAAQFVAETEKVVADLSTRSRDALVTVKDYFRAAPGLPGRALADLAGNMLATVFSSMPRG